MNYRYFISATAVTASVFMALPVAADYTLSAIPLMPDDDNMNVNPDSMLTPIV